MYLRKITLRNIKGFDRFEWELSPGEEPGWHVLLGENGSWKSTILKSMALGFINPQHFAALGQNWPQWTRRTRSPIAETVKSSIRFEIVKSEDDSLYTSIPVGSNHFATMSVTKLQGTRVVPWGVEFRELQKGKPETMFPVGYKKSWETVSGFGAAYGPYRRFSGGSGDEPNIYASLPGVAPFLTVFSERFSLRQSLPWLSELDHRRKDVKNQTSSKSADVLLKQIRAFLNGSEFLPLGTTFEDVDAEGIWFRDSSNVRILLDELSDGYRSMLCIVLEIIRHLSEIVVGQGVSLFTRNDPTSVKATGIVLIDEVDAHLHPTWQHRIGGWFLRSFPNLQFVVTSHSPITCQEATSIWKLSPPGSEAPSRRLTGTEFNRLRYGSILDAFSTGVFGEGVTRSDEGKRKLRELAALNAKALETGLTETEVLKQQEIRESTPTASSRLPQMLEKVLP